MILVEMAEELEHSKYSSYEILDLENICNEIECLPLENRKFTNTFGPRGKCEAN